MCGLPLGITNPLSACCGYGGKYNFNKKVTCGHAGTVDGVSLNLTIPCAEPTTYASWDGIHTSERFNRAVATAFLTGNHITPKGGFRCIPDFSNWYTPYRTVGRQCDSYNKAVMFVLV